MLARSVRLAQLLELAAWLAVGTAVVRHHGASGAWIALAPLLGAPLARLALVCALFALGWWHRAPRPPQERIGAWRTVAMILDEWRAFLAFNLVYLPWEGLWLPRERHPAPGGIPVMLVHGYFANRGYFVPLARHLAAHGVRVASIPTFRAHFATIEAFADELHGAIEALAVRAGAERVALVAHSMGGLAARVYMARHGAGRVAILVTIGTPHHGTALARFGVGANARQMERGSAFLRALEAAERAHAPRLAALSIYSPHDNMVAPQDTSRLSWAQNVAVPGRGHIVLGACDPVADLVAEALARAGVARAV